MTASPQPFDFGMIGRAVWRPVAVWLFTVLGMLAIHQPGAVCLTPAAWVLAVLTGRDCVYDAVSQSRLAVPWGEAGLAGALVGLLDGVIMFAVLVIWTPRAELPAAVGVSLVLTSIGMFVCALIAVGMCMLVHRRVMRDLPEEE